MVLRWWIRKRDALDGPRRSSFFVASTSFNSSGAVFIIRGLCIRRDRDATREIQYFSLSCAGKMYRFIPGTFTARANRESRAKYVKLSSEIKGNVEPREVYMRL